MEASRTRQSLSPNRNQSHYSLWFVTVVVVFVTSLLTATITAVKMGEVFGLLLPAGVVVFPISSIVGDVLTEVHDYRQARKVIWLGFLCNVFSVGAIWVGQILPAAPFWEGQAAYERILGYTPR